MAGAANWLHWLCGEISLFNLLPSCGESVVERIRQHQAPSPRQPCSPASLPGQEQRTDRCPPHNFSERGRGGGASGEVQLAFNLTELKRNVCDRGLGISAARDNPVQG
jgi:hypothetical protein